MIKLVSLRDVIIRANGNISQNALEREQIRPRKPALLDFARLFLANVTQSLEKLSQIISFFRNVKRIRRVFLCTQPFRVFILETLLLLLLVIIIIIIIIEDFVRNQSQLVILFLFS